VLYNEVPSLSFDFIAFISYIILSLQFRIEEGVLKLVVLAMDILTSFVLTGIAYSKHTKESGSDTTNEAKASAGIFGAVGILYALFIIYCCCNQTQIKLLVSDLLIALGGLFYYIGDNLPPLIREYGDELDCDQECIDYFQILGIVVLGAATVTYLPVLTEKEFKIKTTKEVHVVGLLLLTKTTHLDLVYTAIEIAASNKCNEKVTGGAWAYYAVYFIAFFSLCFLYMWNYEREKTKQSTQCTRSLAILIAFLTTAFAASYILADNMLPLACSGMAEADLYLQGIRLVLWGVTVILGVLVLICWWIYAYSRRYAVIKEEFILRFGTCVD